MRSKKSLMVIGVTLTAAMLWHQACQSQSTAPAPTAAPAAAAPATAPAAGATGIKGKVSFTGTAPVMPKLKREADPFCAKTPMTDEEVLVNPNGTLKNVAVRIIKGAAPSATPPAESAVIDQTNCMYRPRIVGVTLNQQLNIKNSDPVLHNVHAYVGATTAFNQAQMKGSKDIAKVMATAGAVKLKCDVHPWMTGYVIVNENPYIAVTGDNGEYTLNVPAGTYTIEAWHEKYGVKTMDVTVAATQATADFAFAAP